MPKLLAASDLSPRSDRALARAARLAAERGHDLVVVKVVDEELPELAAARLAEEARAHLAAVLGAQDGAAAAKAEIRVETGDPAPTLARLAAELEAEALVLGLHRRRPVEEALRGSTLERIVRSTDRPCVLVTAEPEGPYARVLCGVDLSPAAAAALRAARRFAPDAAIRTFHAVHVPRLGFFGHQGGPTDPFVKAARSEVAAWCEAEDLPENLREVEVVEGSVHRAYERTFAAVSPDLMAVGAHGRSTLSPTLLGDFARHMIYEPPCDVLIVRR